MNQDCLYLSCPTSIRSKPHCSSYLKHEKSLNTSVLILCFLSFTWIFSTLYGPSPYFIPILTHHQGLRSALHVKHSSEKVQKSACNREEGANGLSLHSSLFPVLSYETSSSFCGTQKEVVSHHSTA